MLSSSCTGSIGVGESVIRLLSAVPAIARPLLQLYLRVRLPVPDRAAWVILALKRRLVPQMSIRICRIGWNLRLEVDLASTVGRQVFYHGSYEPDLAAFLHGTLRGGDVVIDAGANIGELTVRAARRVGTKGAVIAIEPSGCTLRRLKRNVTLNGMRNVQVVHAAVGGNDGRRALYLGTGPDSLSSSLTAPSDASGETVDVCVTRLDTVARTCGVSRIDVLKLDVEGAEFEALREGAIGLLSQRPPVRVIVLEYNKVVAARMGWSLGDMESLLTAHGYALYVLSRGGQIERLCTNATEGAELPGKIDIVGLCKGS